jgi:DNA-binding PadR family transcriptional regulator
MTPFEHLKKSNTIDNLWLYILALAKEEPIYAYKVRKDISRRFSFKPGMVSSYRVLYRLEIDGFVKSGMKKRKRIYKITKKGEDELKKAVIFFEQAKEKLE